MPPRSASAAEVSVGLLGAGVFAAGTLIPAMKESAHTTLVAVCAANGSHAQHAERKFGFRYCTTDESQLIHDPSRQRRRHRHSPSSACEAGSGCAGSREACLLREAALLVRGGIASRSLRAYLANCAVRAACADGRIQSPLRAHGGADEIFSRADLRAAGAALSHQRRISSVPTIGSTIASREAAAFLARSATSSIC